MPTNIETIREAFHELAPRRRWACYKKVFDPDSGKSSKKPISAVTGNGAKSNDPRTWCSLKDALSFLSKRKGLAGIVLALTAYDNLIGIDIDHCIDDKGAISSTALEIIKLADSYTEISPSGHGIRILLRGELPKGARKNTLNGVEMYDSNRFLTITGNHLPTAPNSINTRPAQVKEIHKRFLQKERHYKTEIEVSIPKTKRSLELEDDELVELASYAANGDTFEYLYEGDWSDYPSQSEADAAFCCMLAWWSGWNAEQMDRIFRTSGLYREKWESVRYSDGRTYGQGLIEWSIQVTNTYYLQEENEDYD